MSSSSSSSSSSSFDSGISPNRTYSSPFSISDILSDDIGQKKSPTSCLPISFFTPGSSSVSKHPVHSMIKQENANQIKCIETPKRPRKVSGSSFPSRTPKISLSEAGTLASSSGGGVIYTAGHLDTRMGTPHKPLNTSLVSPFNPDVLQALRHRPSPSREEKEELFETSLGMLSEVAQYHGELSGTEANSSLEAPVREKFANIRLVTSADEASKGEARDASLILHNRKTLTPSILKRDKRKRVMSAPSDDSTTSIMMSRGQGSLNPGFLSPLANEKSSNSKLSFSPSIFLSRPDHTHSLSSPDHSHNHAHFRSSTIPIPKYGISAAPPTSVARCSVSPSSESDCTHSLSDNDGGGSFVTSTPIKDGKENLVRSDSDDAWSPTILLSKKRRHLKETNEVSSGESDAVKKPRFHGPHRKKSKARTKLSPLLENACSPISKGAPSHLQPSPLTTALATTPTRNAAVSTSHVVPTTGSHLGATTPISMPCPPPPPPPQAFIGSGMVGTHLGHNLFPSSTSVAAINRPFPAASAFLPLNATQITQPHHNLLLQQNHLSRLQNPFTYNPLVCSNPALQGYHAAPMSGYLPIVGLMAPPTNPASYLSYNGPYSPDTQLVSINASYDSSGRSNSRMVVDESARDNSIRHMTSVPPWFIFSNNRSEKRSRLTEAINKSLSETPSQTTKLPAEWTKYACGQTNDQKQMTERARVFMQCRPRQLTFSD